ncbi:MAG: hypothetical protein MUE68_09720 [Bacteroidetes bacterium]|nr:hypothetical protein [Bacteroidota bacterium]
MKLLATLCALIVIALPIQAQTTVSGTINQDSTWTLAASPYIVTGNLTIAATKILKVDSGVVVLFADNTGLIVYGTVNARHALFTSRKDTIGGTPAKGNWNQIQIGDGSNPSTGTFDTCVVRYGGSTTFPSDAANIFAYSGTLTMRACDISFSKNSGIMMGGGSGPQTVTLTGCSIFSCDWPIRYRYTAYLFLNGVNTLTGNAHNAIYVNQDELWGPMTLPKTAVPYVFSSNFTVRQWGSVLQVSSGNTLKFPSWAALNIEGTLVAEALPGEEILFTSATDDNAGGDTNGDATATTPSSGWGGVIFQNTSVDYEHGKPHDRQLQLQQ